jgi:MurNAc alpha-1-phosphate uridylyltransferase
MKAIILAAGHGTRMQPLTLNTPKPLLKVGAFTLIEYHLQALAQANIRDIVINVSYHPKQFTNLLGDGQHYGVKINYSFESEMAPLESGGGMFNVLSQLGPNPFLSVSADLWTDFPFAQLPKTLEGLAHVVLVNNPDFHPRGDFCLHNGFAQAEGKNKLNFGGIGVYHPDLFINCQPGKFPIAPLLSKAMQNKQVTGEHYQGAWWNVGTVKELQALKNYLNNCHPREACPRH